MIREDVVRVMVAWKRAGKGPDDDPDRKMYALMNTATWEELIEAMKRLNRADA